MTMRSKATRLAAWAAAALVLSAVFALYTRADMAIMLSEQLWACFGR